MDLIPQHKLINIQIILENNFPDKALITISVKENLNIDLWLKKLKKYTKKIILHGCKLPLRKNKRIIRHNYNYSST